MKYSYFLLLILLYSCNKKNDYVIFLSTNDTVEIKSINWVHQANKQGKVATNLYIELEEYSKVYNLVKPKMKIKLGDNFYSANGVKKTFGREVYDTDLIYFYKNDTKRIVIDTIDGRQMILFWPEKPRYYNLLENLNIESVYE